MKAIQKETGDTEGKDDLAEIEVLNGGPSTKMRGGDAASGSSPARMATGSGFTAARANDLSSRFPLIVEALARLPRSCIIDGETLARDDRSEHHKIGPI